MAANEASLLHAVQKQALHWPPQAGLWSHATRPHHGLNQHPHGYAPSVSEPTQFVRCHGRTVAPGVASLHPLAQPHPPPHAHHPHPHPHHEGVVPGLGLPYLHPHQGGYLWTYPGIPVPDIIAPATRTTATKSYHPFHLPNGSLPQMTFYRANRLFAESDSSYLFKFAGQGPTLYPFTRTPLLVRATCTPAR